MKLRRRLRRLLRRSKRNFLISGLMIAIGSFILCSDIFYPHDKISCHFIRSNNSFPILERRSKLPSWSIFFHVTTCSGTLDSRQHCAIESASIKHPEWQINVVFSGPVVHMDSFNKKKFNNVKFWRIHIEEFSKGTPYEKLVKRDIFRKCKWSVQLSQDVLKYMTMAQWGGIYLDLDMVVAQPLGSLARNWVSRESDDTIGESVLAFSKDAVGRNVSEIALQEMESILRRGDCSRKRSMVMSNVLKRICSTPDAVYMSSATCNGFEVYGPQFFHPIPETRAQDYFVPGELSTSNPYTYHLWDRITKEFTAMRHSPLNKLGRRFCPLTFNLYSEQFGIRYKFENFPV